MSPNIEPKQKNIIDADAWEQSMKVALSVLKKKVPDPTNGSTHYLAPKVMASRKYIYPKWSKQYQLVAVIDNHKFYKPVDKKVAAS
jgi:spore germination cell wall hydrolase CwlJ-like protein